MTKTTFDSTYDTGTASLIENLFLGWQSTLGNIKHSYATTADTLVDEILATLSQEQLNDALNTYVVKNVGLLLALRLELFDGYLRLSCSANFLGLYLSVAANFKLTQVRADRHIQRLVFEQISDTQIFELHANSWWKVPAIKSAIWAYRTLLKKDPLPFLLSLSPKLKGKPFIEYKGRFIYLDVGRWLPDGIKSYLKKAQVNSGIIEHEQLLLKVQPNFADILSFGDPNAPVITEADNPNRPNVDS